MKQLPSAKEPTDNQKAVVEHILETGDTVTDTAECLGIPRSSASRMLHYPHVQSYMMARVTETLGMGSLVAAAEVMKLVRGARSEYVKLQAAQDVLDRAGFKAPEKHQHLVAGGVSINIDLS